VKVKVGLPSNQRYMKLTTKYIYILNAAAGTPNQSIGSHHITKKKKKRLYNTYIHNFTFTYTKIDAIQKKHQK